jgi:hypothetical protein
MLSIFHSLYLYDPNHFVGDRGQIDAPGNSWDYLLDDLRAIQRPKTFHWSRNEIACSRDQLVN